MRLSSVISVAALAIAGVSAYAQPIISAKSGVIAGVEGQVFLDNAAVQDSVTHFPEMKEGSVLRTEAGRVELMLPPGFMLRMGENGSLKLLANRLIDTRVEMQSGSAVVEVDQTKPDFNVTIALKDGNVTLSKAGVYRFDTNPAQLKVFHGSASVEIGGQTVMVSSGKMLPLSGGASAAVKFDADQTDALDNWSTRRAEAMAMANLSGAKYSNDSYTGPVAGNSWLYNPYYGIYTYMPMSGTMCNSFYGLCFYSPFTAYRAFYFGAMGYGFGYGIPTFSYGPSVAVGGGASYNMHGAGTAFSSGLGTRGGTNTAAGAFSGGGAVSAGGAAGGGHMGGGGGISAGGGGGHMGGGGTGGHGK